MSKDKRTTKDEKLGQYAESVAAWKGKHGKVSAFFVEGDDDRKVIFFRQPNRHELSSAENLSTSSDGNIDLYKKGERHLADCYLGGDLTIEQILGDTSVYIPTMKFMIAGLIEEKKSSWETC